MADPTDAEKQFEDARASLAKLPLLGPVLWLYARDERRKWTFLADHEWLLMPPLVLGQCKLYSKQELPWAFFTWAFVNDAVDQRLRSGEFRIAPHEWAQGPHCWLIDGIAPFGGMEELLTDLRNKELKGRTVHRVSIEANVAAKVQTLPPLN